jgi:hypothetical protein
VKLTSVFWIRATIVFWIVLGLVGAYVFASPVFHKYLAIGVVWFASLAINMTLFGAMLEPTGLTLKQVQSKRVRGMAKAREAVRLAAQAPRFRRCWWGSLAFLFINLAAPFVLFAYVPAWTAATIVLLNFGSSAMSAIVRPWIWRAARGEASEEVGASPEMKGAT